MKTISAVIPAYNEEVNIGDCIRSMKWCQEIIVVDQHSTDRTAEIARELGATVYQYISPEPKSSQKQRWHGMEKAQSEWILCLDADERISPALEEEIKAVMREPGDTVGFHIPFKNIFFGHEFKYSGLESLKLLRLVKKGHAKYLHGAMVHEQLNADGPVRHLENHILHYGTRDISHYLRKFNRYTSSSAEKMYAEGRRLTWLNSFLCFIIKPLYYFFRIYFVKKGFLDGAYGFLFAFLTANTVVFNHLKLWELQRARANSGE